MIGSHYSPDWAGTSYVDSQVCLPLPSAGIKAVPPWPARFAFLFSKHLYIYLFFYLLVFVLCACVCACIHMYRSTHMKVRGQPLRGLFLSFYLVSSGDQTQAIRLGGKATSLGTTSLVSLPYFLNSLSLNLELTGLARLTGQKKWVSGNNLSLPPQLWENRPRAF